MNEPLRIVAIGGGTGLSTLLQGLKPYAQNPKEIDITAIVTVTDDGGSSGRLRREFDVLPPGDIRNCIVALSEDGALLSKLFQYRFEDGRGLRGHSFGNLFLTALTSVTGDFARAVKLSSEILVSCGHIYPSTARNVTLEAELANGAVLFGETRISKSTSRIIEVRLRPHSVDPLPEALQAIAEADLISLGPGSLYTSIVPNLLVAGVPEAIAKSPAIKAYFVNLMWQPGETIGLTASDHLAALNRHAAKELVDVVIVNDQPLPDTLLPKYAEQRSKPVLNDFSELNNMGVKVLATNLLCDSGMIRHDPKASAAVVVVLAHLGRQRREKIA